MNHWEIREGWNWIPMADLVEPRRRQVKPSDAPSDLLYVGLEHVTSARGLYTGVPVSDVELKSAKLRFENGDLLFGKLRPNLRKCALAREAGICSTDLIPLRPLDPALGPLLAVQLRSEAFADMVSRLVEGANLPRLSVADLMGSLLPMPPDSSRARLMDACKDLQIAWESMAQLENDLRGVQYAIEHQVLGL